MKKTGIFWFQQDPLLVSTVQASQCTKNKIKSFRHNSLTPSKVPAALEMHLINDLRI